MEKTKGYLSPTAQLISIDITDIVTFSNGDVVVDVSGLFGQGGAWGNSF
jgi:hypothetical protein